MEMRKSKKQHMIDNPDMYKGRVSESKLRRIALGDIPRETVDELFDLQKGECACCDAYLGNNFHVDHIMPITLGGTNDAYNLQLLKPECNLEKSGKHPAEWLTSLPQNSKLFGMSYSDLTVRYL